MAITLNGSTGIVEANIADSAITSSKIASIAASKLTGQVADANAPSGSIIQVVQATANAASYTNYGSYVDFISGSITTTVANSKILVTMNIPYYCAGNSSAWSVSFYVRLSENGSLASSYEHPGPQTGAETAQMVHTSYLSDAKSVGTYTYTGGCRGTSGAGTFTLARTVDGAPGKVRLLMMEIAP